jgi:hypothetical protein
MPSSAIRELSFDPARSELTVTFATGRVYVYAKVPEFTYHRFVRAGSKGRFFNTEIRDKYRFRELSGPAQEPDDRSVSTFRDALRIRNSSPPETDADKDGS